MDEPLQPQPLPSNGKTVVHLPVDVRSASLAVLAVIASVALLRWAAEVVVPLLIGVMLSYALGPVVDTLVRWRLPRALAAALTVLSLIGLAGLTGWSLKDDATQLVESLPATAQKLRQLLQQRRADTPLDKVQQAAAELQQVTVPGAQARPPRGVTRVVVEPSRFDLSQYLWSGTLGLVTFVGQAVIVCFITFFTLAAGDSFRRKLVKIAGPGITKKKLTVQMLDEITAQIQRYLLVQVFSSIVVGITTWLAFWALGLKQAGAWGLLAGVLNLVPYLGAILVTVGAALVGFVQFGSLEMALAVGGASFVIQLLEGYLLVPWLTSRAGRMSPVVVFASVLLFGWMWGGWGLVLGVPVVMAIKAVCDHVDELKPLGELLGR